MWCSVTRLVTISNGNSLMVELDCSQFVVVMCNLMPLIMLRFAYLMIWVENACVWIAFIHAIWNCVVFSLCTQASYKVNSKPFIWAGNEDYLLTKRRIGEMFCQRIRVLLCSKHVSFLRPSTRYITPVSLCWLVCNTVWHIKTDFIQCPAAHSLTSHCGPNREHLMVITENGHLLILSACFTEKKILSLFQRTFW